MEAYLLCSRPIIIRIRQKRILDSIKSIKIIYYQYAEYHICSIDDTFSS